MATGRRRRLLAGLLLGAAAITAFPAIWQQLADAPLLSWLLAALGATVLWFPKR